MSDDVVITCSPDLSLLALDFNDPNPGTCSECGRAVVISKDGRKLQAEKNAKLLCVDCTRKKMGDPEFELAGPVPGEFSQRVEELRKDVGTSVAGGFVIAAWIMCNGCGKKAQVFSDEDLEGWHLGGHRAGTDLCPDCQKKFLKGMDG